MQISNTTPLLAIGNAGLLDTAAAKAPKVVTLATLTDAYLEDYQLREFRTLDTARPRAAHLARFFGIHRVVAEITPAMIRAYQVHRRREGASAATVNRETSALSRMFRLGVQLGWLSTMPIFPGRLLENGPRQGFFEHTEYQRVRRHLPAPYRDVLDFAYYSGWRRREILGLRWDEVDLAGGVIRLSPSRSKTRTGRVLPVSAPLADVLKRRARKRTRRDLIVFKRDGVTVRAWRRAWGEACEAAADGRAELDSRRHSGTSGDDADRAQNAECLRPVQHRE